MKYKNIDTTPIFWTLILFLTACVSSPSNYQEMYSQNNCWNQASTRTPSAALLCTELFDEPSIKNKDTSYLQRLQTDPLAVAEARMSESTGAEKYPVKTSSEMRRFRDRFLGFIKNILLREPVARSFESSLRMRSRLAEKAIQRSNNYSQYDMVIVGTGVHGIIALHQALAQNPKLRILLVDEGDTAGATFRYGKELFDINSSNRPSGEDSRPLPGEGNINELPGLPIQVSDLTAVKYPTANDLGVALVSGLYAAVREHPQVDVLFNTKATQFLQKTRSADFGEGINLFSETSGSNFRIEAQKIILSTGLGEPGLPKKVAETVKSIPALKTSVDGKIPRVITFEDFIRMVAMSNDPAQYFKNKDIGIVGQGDSANVLVQYLLGFAPREGYARSSAQDGKVRKIRWIGQDAATCKDFIDKARSRYANNGTGFKSSSLNVEAIISPYAKKLSDVSEKGKNKVNATLEDGSNIDGMDYIIVTTGFEPNVRGLFDELTKNQNQQFRTDADFFENMFETLLAKTSASLSQVKVGRQFKGREIYVVGTAADLFIEENQQKAPAGIVQNFVSIFNNAPRVVATVKNFMKDLEPKASRSALATEKLNRVETPQSFKITQIQESRFIPNQTLNYLESTFKEALSYCTNTSGEKISLTIHLEKNGTLEINSESKIDLKNLISLLAESREFFSLAKELLKFTPDQNLMLTASPNGLGFDLAGARMQLSSAEVRAQGSPIEIKNATIKLRGLRDKKEARSSTPQENTKAERPREISSENAQYFDLNSQLGTKIFTGINGRPIFYTTEVLNSVTRVTYKTLVKEGNSYVEKVLFSNTNRYLNLTEVAPGYFLVVKEASFQDTTRTLALVTEDGLETPIKTINVESYSRLDFQTVDGKTFLIGSQGSLYLFEYDLAQRKVELNFVGNQDNASLSGDQIEVLQADDNYILTRGLRSQNISWRKERVGSYSRPPFDPSLPSILQTFSDRISLSLKDGSYFFSLNSRLNIPINIGALRVQKFFQTGPREFVGLANKTGDNLNSTPVLIKVKLDQNNQAITFLEAVPGLEGLLLSNPILLSNGSIVGVVSSPNGIARKYNTDDIIAIRPSSENGPLKLSEIRKNTEEGFRLNPGYVSELPDGSLFFRESDGGKVFIFPLEKSR